MEVKNPIWKDTAVVAAGQALGSAALIGIFALVGHFDLTVLLGSLAGALLATANYFFMYLFASIAADKAQKQQDVAGGQKLVQLSYMGRMVGLLVVLILLAQSGWCNVIALALPLAFTRPILTIYELILKKGGAKE